MTAQTDEWLTVAEASRRLKVTRATLYRWARSGKLRMYSLGGRSTRLRLKDVEALLTERYPMGRVTIVGLSGHQVLEITPETKTVRDAVVQFAPDLVLTGEVYVSQERCEDLDRPLRDGNVIVVLPPGAAEGLKSGAMSEEEEQGWLKLAESSFARDWDNEYDAIYDNWRELYGISDG